MHTEMWEHPAVQDNLTVLRRRGVDVVPPERGRLAGGDVGEGRLAEPAVVAGRVLQVLGSLDEAGTPPGVDRRPGDLTGRRVVVSAGGTREPIDPVRFLTNRSSGKQGLALAEAAARRGATVTLVSTAASPVSPDVARNVEVVAVETAAELEAAMLTRAPGADVVVMAAAVADFRPANPATHKLSKEDGLPKLLLEPTPDILAALVRRREPGQVIVGFAAETVDILERAQRKLERKGVDLLVVNDVGAPGVGFDHDTNAVTILDASGLADEISLRPKAAVAHAVLDRVVARLREEKRNL
jgi:phosphopantothenoylcysteine decarboxylase/phosphopantothenate--cysteine ligase